MSSSVKKKIIIGLFITAVIILISNIIYDRIYSLPEPEKKIEINKDVINQIFNKALYSLGLEENWIKTDTSKGLFLYKISIPTDLPITVVLNEIFSSFETYSVALKSEEEKINGKTYLKIFSGDVAELNAEFYYDKEISRNTGEIGIYISSVSDLSIDEFSNLLSTPEIFEILLVPSKDSEEKLKIIKEFNRNYGIILNDEISELDYKLSEKYSDTRIKSSIRSIVGKFYYATVFLIDNNSNLFSSDIHSLLLNEFTKRKIDLIKIDSLITLNSNTDDENLQKFSEIIDKTKRGDSEVFIVPAGEFESLRQEIIKFRKIGYKFVHPSGIIKNNL